MGEDFKMIAKGYLYSPWNGTLKEYKGEVIHRDSFIEVNKYIVPEKNYFAAKDENGRILKMLACSSVEGKVVNKVLWLTESDIHKAAQLFIEYEEAQIAQLKFKIENHESLIKPLGKLGERAFLFFSFIFA